MATTTNNAQISGISSESAEQMAVVEYCAYRRIPVVHIANEGKRSTAEGGKLKKEGLQKGFPDLFFPFPAGEYHGLAIEMKYGKNKLTPEQKMWLASLAENGYRTAVCYSFDAARKVIDSYAEKSKEPLPEVMLFGFIRNSQVLPLGRKLGKSDEEIDDMTLATINAGKELIDVKKTKESLDEARRRKYGSNQ